LDDPELGPKLRKVGSVLSLILRDAGRDDLVDALESPCCRRQAVRAPGRACLRYAICPRDTSERELTRRIHTKTFGVMCLGLHGS
jgi:hypothetical protein